MKPNICTIHSPIFFVLLSVMLGLALGLVFGLGFVYFQNQGAFVSWEPFSAPIRFERIIAATSTTIWAQANDDSIYQGNILCQEEDDCQQWQVVQQVPVDLPVTESPIKRSSACDFSEFSFVKPLAGEPVECIEAYFGGYDSSTMVYYALLNDGSISMWKHSRSSITALIIPVFSTVGFGISAGIIGFIYWVERISGNNVSRNRAG